MVWALDLLARTDAVEATWRASPANALAGDDEGGGFRRVGPAFKKSPSRDDRNDQHKGRQQIDMSGIVTTVADFPARCS
jgi:hypothetical protein